MDPKFIAINDVRLKYGEDPSTGPTAVLAGSSR